MQPCATGLGTNFRLLKLDSYRCDQLINLLGSFGLHGGYQMAVDIQGGGGLGMTQSPGNYNHEDSRIEHQRGRGVTQIMEADIWQADVFHSL